MATEIRVPTLGESVTEATIGKWFKKVGDAIAADEPIVELETDKVTIEVPAPAAGTLSEITVNEGETVGLGALLGQISAGGAAAKPAAKAAEEAEAKPRPSPKRSRRRPALPAPTRSRKRPKKTAAVAGDAGAVEERKMPPAPAAAKLLAEANLAVDQVAGSGKRGQVLKGDVLDAIAKGAPSQPAETPRVAEAPKAARAPSSGDDAVARGARAHDQAAPDHRAPAQGSAVDRRHAHHLQRGGHEGQSWICAPSTRTCSRRSTA